MILCVLVPHFAAAVERRADAKLAEGPLVIWEPAGRSAKVYAVSPEAEAMGVGPGMPVHQAEALCPRVRLIPAIPSRYQRALEELVEILSAFAPVVEAGGFQPSATAFLDAGNLREGECIETIIRTGQAVRRETRLTPAIGLTGAKFAARLCAALVEPGEALWVAPDYLGEFLAPLSVDLLPLDGEAARWLRLLGIRTLGQLAVLPSDAVQSQLGSRGRFWHRLAQGRDASPLLPYRPGRVERAARQFEAPISDRNALEAAVRDLAARLASRLRAAGLASQELRMALYLEDGATREESLFFRRPASGTAQIAQALGVLLSQAQAHCGVTELEVTLAGLVPATGQQLDLFAHGDGQERQLRQALQGLAARYGPDRFYRISWLDQGARLPERRFRLQEAQER